MLEYGGKMALRSTWTGLLLLVVMAVACFGPACGVACAAKMPCHDDAPMAMMDCAGMMMGPSVSAAPNHVAVCSTDEAVVDRTDFDLHTLVHASSAVQVSQLVTVERRFAGVAVRGMAKAPPRLAVVMRV